MAKTNAIHQLNSLRLRWLSFEVAAGLLVAFSAAMFCFVVFHTWWSVFVFIIGACISVYLLQPWKITIIKVSGLLNRTYPQMEESCGLVTKPDDQLNLLEKLQRARVETVLEQFNGQPKQITNHLKQAAIFALFILAASFTVDKTRDRWHSASGNLFGNSDHEKPKSAPEIVLPQISAVQVSITPPAYTHKGKRQQNQFTLNVEEGSTINWHIRTNIPIKKMSLVFNENETVHLYPDNVGTDFSVQKNILKPGFYQVNLDGKLSDLYQVLVIKDNPPVIRITTPKSYTHIDAGEAPRVNINTTITDDYGIGNALIMATVAKGSGESVKFKEYKIPFSGSFVARSPQYNLNKLIDLPALHMEPGDELYFYISATDTHNQQSKTDVYTVSIQDTAQLLSMDGIVSGVDLKPEFFRSERQIILDSERLLKEKDTISKESFNNRCNDLGIDQKLLRLRYGKFLGEESESSVGDAKVENGNNKADPTDFSNADKIRDAYTDKHDNAEDATFFDATLKAQLKATLTEMWNAELHLRMYKPQEALPFEYKALRLLKDLQQKSRSYVAKTAYNPPPFKMEKRLSGELGKIIQPDSRYNTVAFANQFATLQSAIPVLEQLKARSLLNMQELHILQLTEQQLSSRASAQPAQYLASVSAMHRILKFPAKASVYDLGLVEKAIAKTLQPGKPMPQALPAQADAGLSQQYYKNLNPPKR